MDRSSPVDGFSLAYDDVGSGDPVVLLHGWPGHRGDFAKVVPLLADQFRLVVPDLRGFGGSDRHEVDPVEGYSAAAQIRSVHGLLDDLGIERAVFAGYDVGARLLHAAALSTPGRMRAVATTPPLPGAGRRMLAPQAQEQFWYQAMHRLPVADQMIDGRPEVVRAYLRHIWQTWSGPEFPLSDDEFDRLVALYARPGAFRSSIGWYRSRPVSVGVAAEQEEPPAPQDRVTVPFEVLWPEHDPLFLPAWSDRLDEWFADVRLQFAPASGHFVPLEAPEAFAAAVVRAADRAG